MNFREFLESHGERGFVNGRPVKVGVGQNYPLGFDPEPKFKPEPAITTPKPELAGIQLPKRSYNSEFATRRRLERSPKFQLYTGEPDHKKIRWFIGRLKDQGEIK